MTRNEPKPEEWRALYEAGEAFRSIEPWKWMHESYMFGVQDPDSGEVAYCAVIGQGKSQFGLSMFVGIPGLMSFMKLASMAEDIEDIEEMAERVALEQDSLMLMFGRKGELDSEDLRLLTKLGIKPKGREAWPLFRSMKPFSVPWRFTAAEARLATVALQQAREVCLEFKDNPERMMGSNETSLMVRTPEVTAQGISWSNQWPPLPAPPDDLFPAYSVPPERARQILANAKQTTAVWEAAYLPLPFEWPGSPNERPYLTLLFLVADAKGLTLTQATAPANAYREPFGEHLLALIEKLGILPAEIRVVEQEMLALLMDISLKLHLALAPVDDLPALNKTVEKLFSSMEGLEE